MSPMYCKECETYLSAYIDGELDTTYSEKLEEHINSCDRCKAELMSILKVKKAILDKVAHRSAPEGLKHRILFELRRIEDYRESGVKVLDLVRWGSHIAQLYDDKDDLVDILVPYIAKGLEQNERCIWVTKDLSKDDILNALKTIFSNPYRYMDTGQLSVVNYKDWYLSSGRFNANEVLNKAIEEYRSSVAEGYLGLRSTGTLSWLDPKDWNDFMIYEKELNDNIPNFRALIVCSYRRDLCPKDGITCIADTHGFVISKYRNDWRLIKR